jgi:error-prone DNA polymerase
VEGTLERFASAGGAINLLVTRIAPLEAPELLDRRPSAEVKDFSMLDARELARIQAEAQAELPQVAVAVVGGATADHVRPAASASGPPTDGAEDFRAVAPPIMSFAQGRRR